MNVLSSNSRNVVSSSLCLNNVFCYEPPESRRASSCRDVKEEHRLMRRPKELWPWAWKQSGVTVSNPDDLTPLFSTQRGKLDSCVTGTEVRVFQPSCLATHSVCVSVCVISYTCNMRVLECFGNIVIMCSSSHEHSMTENYTNRSERKVSSYYVCMFHLMDQTNTQNQLRSEKIRFKNISSHQTWRNRLENRLKYSFTTA